MTAVEKNIMRPRSSMKREPKEYEERVIEVNRVSRVVKGGRRIRFRALVVVGNHNGKVGMGVAKANEVAEAVRKATTYAKKHIVLVPIIDGSIPHEVFIKQGGAKVLLKPAAQGTSIVAGGSIRSVAELVGITDLLSKSLGSSNKINNVAATIKALSSFIPEVVEKVKIRSEKSKPKGEPVVMANTPKEEPVEVEAKEAVKEKTTEKNNVKKETKKVGTGKVNTKKTTKK